MINRPSERLERHLDPRADIFVPLSVLYADDLAVARVSATAELVWVRGLAMARGRVTDGRISARAMIGYLYGKLTADEVTAGIAELAATNPPLWLTTDDPDVFVIRSWAKYHEPVDEVVDRRAAQRAGGEKGNHLRHHVRGKRPNTDCQLCIDQGLVPRPAKPLVLGTESVGEEATRQGGDSQEVEVEGDTDLHLQLLQEGLGTESVGESGTEQRAPSPAHRAAEVAQAILDELGYVNPREEHSRPLLDAVTKALAHGHRPKVIQAKATTPEIAASTGASPALRAKRAVEHLIGTTPEPDPMAGIDDSPPPAGPWPERTERTTELIDRAKAIVRPPLKSDDEGDQTS